MATSSAMRVTGVYTYPIKGCYRLEHERADVERWGLAGDRRWMVIDANTSRAVTQRELPALTQIRPRTTRDGLILGTALRQAGMADLPVPAPLHEDKIDVALFAYTGPAALAGPAADDWLSAVLSAKVRLVWLDDPTSRAVNPDYAEPGDTVSFADGYPVLLANVASLNSLNDLIVEAGSLGGSLGGSPGGSLEGPLPMERFRPNIVITGGPAWIEDEWTGGRIRIGPVTFRVPKPCARCVVTTTDQETGERGREPLRTLARHRNVNQSLLFGTNLIPDAPGTIAIGDPVEPL